jgi:enoyl-CoA hydratase/carnithine racemase
MMAARFFRDLMFRRSNTVSECSNSHVQVQIITGSGRAFCAGDHISLLTQVADTKATKDLLIDCIYGLYSTIIYLQKPLIPAVNGYAYGGGIHDLFDKL